MHPQGMILIADDEESFRESTSRFLQREGFGCQCAGDADEAVRYLQNRPFDLVLADIRMPHNPDLRLVREIRSLDRQVPVIIVTGYPSTQTAIRSLELSVLAYLVKPIDLDELLGHVHTAMRQSEYCHRLSAVRNRLQCCIQDFDSHSEKATGEGGHVATETIRTLAACLSELLQIRWAEKPGNDSECFDLCQMINCPQESRFRAAIVRTIDVLKKTKETFRCKDLADLRFDLQRLLKGTKE